MSTIRTLSPLKKGTPGAKAVILNFTFLSASVRLSSMMTTTKSTWDWWGSMVKVVFILKSELSTALGQKEKNNKIELYLLYFKEGGGGGEKE